MCNKNCECKKEQKPCVNKVKTAFEAKKALIGSNKIVAKNLAPNGNHIKL